MKKHEIVAMLLAGGKGTRLGKLTEKVAKPVVGFGGKYKIIDFALSSIANSGIDAVGVLTQYEQVKMNLYIGNGAIWGINSNKSITTLLSPSETNEGASWYLGTADAVYQNIEWLDTLKPKYVLILSADHIYKMDFEDMLNFHKKTNSDVTIACYKVDIKEASRFGVCVADKNKVITDFVEKPKKPVSDLVSMGIYIFNYKLLREALIKDSKDEKSEHDFGHNIIPELLKNQKKISAYEFNGYWRDVGTLQSLYDANMDLLKRDCKLGLLDDNNKKIYSEDVQVLPTYYGMNSSVSNSIVNQGSFIDGTVENSVIFSNVNIKSGAVIKNCVVMEGVTVENDVTVTDSLISPNSVVTNETLEKKGTILYKVGEK